ncbi:MAG: glycosyltransferase family 39 protein, partial [Vicinamibacteria bacterium]|nr:glycosyltransferase family 39 protein [Vicinamibacteria bacterium]
FHLRWAQRLIEDRNDGREEFRFDSKTPTLLPAVVLRRALLAQGVRSEQALRFSSRIPSLVVLAALLLLVGRLARTEDPATWWIGLLLAALDPNLAAHASIATTDLPYAAVVLALAGAISLPDRLPGRPWLMGTIIGVAFAVKYTALLLLPVAGLFLLVRRGASLRLRLGHLGAAMVSAGLTVSVLYLGVGVFQRLGDIPFQTPILRSIAAALPSLPLPIPRAVVTGIDVSMAHNDPAHWASYIFGEEHRGGVWYYFVANWFMKTPVALIPVILLGIWRLRRKWSDSPVLAMGALFLIHLGYFSLFFSTQIGLRFALPCVALGCALSARGLRNLKVGWFIAAAALSLAERAPYWGDPIAFTNLSVWPKSRAYWYTADSNLDYGQNRSRLARYGKETGLALVMGQATITPGLYVIGANELVIFDSRRSHRWLVDNNVPAVNVGFTHFAFSITGERFDDYLNASRMAPALLAGDDACAGALPHFPPGTQIPFEQTVNPLDGRLWLVCSTSRKGADIGFMVTAGRVWFGRITGDGICEADLLQQGQQAWFRIPRGVDARLCLQEIPLRRSHLQYQTLGYLTIRGQGADVDLRPVPADAFRLNASDSVDRK